MQFRTLIADPPWPYGQGAIVKTLKTDGSIATGVGIEDHYSPMTMDELLALRPPVEDNAHAYIWTTNAFMEEAHQLLRAWGFQPKTILTWVKTKHDGGGVSMKTGYYFRGATEHCVFGVRGSLPLSSEEALPTAWLWPRLPHSRKPIEFMDLVEKASPGPYLDIFARPDDSLFFDREGWTRIGDAIDGKDIRDALKELASLPKNDIINSERKGVSHGFTLPEVQGVLPVNGGVFPGEQAVSGRYREDLQSVSVSTRSSLEGREPRAVKAEKARLSSAGLWSNSNRARYSENENRPDTSKGLCPQKRHEGPSEEVGITLR